MDLLPGETVVWRGHPSWRGSIRHYVIWGFLALVPAIIAGLLRANDADTGLPYYQWTLISLVLLALVIIVDTVKRSATTYTVTTRRIHIRRGILRRQDQSTHIDRVQNLNTRQHLLERLLGVGSVDFDTAGTEADEASFTFHGVANPNGLVHKVEVVRSQGASAPGAGGL